MATREVGFAQMGIAAVLSPTETPQSELMLSIPPK